MPNQSVEGAFSMSKRGVVGSYLKLGVEHLDQSLGESLAGGSIGVAFSF